MHHPRKVPSNSSFYSRMLILGILIGTGGGYLAYEKQSPVKKEVIASSRKSFNTDHTPYSAKLKSAPQKIVADKPKIPIKDLCFMGETLLDCKEACKNPSEKTYEEMFNLCTIDD